MKRILFLAISVLLLSLNVSAADSSNSEELPKEITIGMIPGGNPEKLREQSLALAKALQAELNVPVNIYISKNYAGLVEAMKQKKVDFAFFSSLTYVFAEKQAGAKVLLKTIWNQPYYYSTIVTPKDSGIKSLKNLKGKKLAYVDEKSSSGYLYPQLALKKEGLKDSDMKEIVFSGNHQASIQLLETRKVDAAAVFSDDEKGTHGAWEKFSTNKKMKYRMIWVSAPIPNDPFCVRQDFYDKYPKVTHSLMFSLIETSQAGKDRTQYSEILGSHDLMPATSKQYDPVREMVKALNIELKPE